MSGTTEFQMTDEDVVLTVRAQSGEGRATFSLHGTRDEVLELAEQIARQIGHVVDVISP